MKILSQIVDWNENDQNASVCTVLVLGFDSTLSPKVCYHTGMCNNMAHPVAENNRNHQNYEKPPKGPDCQ